MNLRSGTVALLTASCATTPVTVAPCTPQSFSCRGQQPAEPTEAREFVEQNTVIYPIVTGLPPEQVAQTLCEQVLGPSGSASVLGNAVSVQETPSMQGQVRALLLNVDKAPVVKSDALSTGRRVSASGGHERCSLQNFSCRGRQPPEPIKARKIADPATVLYPILTDVPLEQLAQTLCEQILTPRGSASVLGKAVSVQDTPGTQERIRQALLNIDVPSGKQ